MGHNFAGSIGVDNRVADCTALDRVIRFRLDHEIIGLSTARFICQSVSNREPARCVCSHLGLHRLFLADNSISNVFPVLVVQPTPTTSPPQTKKTRPQLGRVFIYFDRISIRYQCSFASTSAIAASISLLPSAAVMPFAITTFAAETATVTAWSRTSLIAEASAEAI